MALAVLLSDIMVDVLRLPILIIYYHNKVLLSREFFTKNLTDSKKYVIIGREMRISHPKNKKEANNYDVIIFYAIRT